MSESILKPLCTPENYLRNTFYSDIFRVDVILDGVVRTLDIERIQIPFNPVRERMLREKYKMDTRSVHAYYRDLSRSIRHGIVIPIRLRQDSGFMEKNSQSVVTYLHQEVVRSGEQDAFELYLLTDPMSRYLDSPNCPDEKISLYTFISKLSARLTATLHMMHERGIYIGMLDPDSICCLGDSGYIVLSSFIYARAADDKQVFPYPKVMPIYAHPSLARGEQPSEMTDLFSLGAILISILNGSYGTSHPSLSLEGDYPQTLINALQGAISGEMTLKGFVRAMRSVKSDTFWADASSMFIPLNLAQPDYFSDSAPTETDPASASDVLSGIVIDDIELGPPVEEMEISFVDEGEDSTWDNPKAARNTQKGHAPRHIKK